MERMMDNLDKELDKKTMIVMESKLFEIRIERQITLLEEYINENNKLIDMRLTGLKNLISDKEDFDKVINDYISEGDNNGR
jgi:ribosomal protein S18